MAIVQPTAIDERSTMALRPVRSPIAPQIGAKIADESEPEARIAPVQYSTCASGCTPMCSSKKGMNGAAIRFDPVTVPCTPTISASVRRQSRSSAGALAATRG